MTMLTRVLQSGEPWRELHKVWAVVVSNSEAVCLQQLVKILESHVDSDELEDLVREFATQGRTCMRLGILRQLAVRAGDVNKLRHLLTSADQLEMDQLLTYTLHWAPADARKDIISLLLNQSDTKYETSANRNSRLNGKTAFHVAAEYGYHDLLILLVPSKPEHSNALTQAGATALHCITREVHNLSHIPKGENKETHITNLIKCVKIVIEELNIDINITDNGGITAVHIASNIESWEIVKYLIEKQANVDVFVRDKSARDIITVKQSDIQIPYSMCTQESENIIKHLFELAVEKRDDKFIEELEKFVEKKLKENIKSIVDSNNGEYTLLQAVVKLGLPKSTKMLLDLGANINERCGNLNTPVMMAVTNCNDEILEILLRNKALDLSLINSCSEMYTVLHLAVMNSKSDDCQCIKMLCEFNLNKTLDVNKMDYRNKSALHYAVEMRQDNNIVHLLRNNANIFILNDEDIPAFAGIDVQHLSGYLDDQIKIEGTPFDKNNTYKMITNYEFLVTPTENITSNKIISGNESNSKETSYLITLPENVNTSPDMQSLLLLAKSKPYKSLLNHPLIRSFLHLKWHRFFWLFYINFMMLAIFTSSFSVYIYYLVNDVNMRYGQKTTSSVANETIDTWAYGISQYVAATMLSFLIIRELFQYFIAVSFWHYISYIVNLVEVTLIVISIFLLFIVPYDYHAIHTLSAIGILLAFAELVILIGSHPVLTIYYTMLFRVGKDFLYFLLWYSLLVIAFGISFYILFQHCDSNKEDECSANLFTSMWSAIFRTTVMLQGEFDANSLQFDSFSIISHVIFLLFFFAMVIVLMNLLNGLAVNDVQIIKNESDIIAMETQVKLYAKFESIIFNIINKKCESLGSFFIDHSVLLTGLLKENKIEFSLTKKHNIIPDVRNCCNRHCFDCNSGKICGLNINCINSKHFKKIFPLCFEFEKIIQEMITVRKERITFVRNFDADIENERSRCKFQREQEKMLMEMSLNQKLILDRQDYLEEIISNMRMKLESICK